jgi:hypothetical protein
MNVPRAMRIASGPHGVRAIVTSSRMNALPWCRQQAATPIEPMRKIDRRNTVRKPQHKDGKSSNRHRDAMRASLGIPTLSASTQTRTLGIADAEIDEACFSEQIE